MDSIAIMSTKSLYHKTPSFITAGQFATPHTLRVPQSLRLYLGGTIRTFEPGAITLLEGDRKSIRELHQELLRVMVHAVMDQWQIKLIDISNTFDPHRLSTLAFEEQVSPHHILENISLARPFQIFQSASIIKQLHEDVLKQPSTTPLETLLIVVTGISSQFLDPGQASEDKDFPVRQLELLRHSLGILQGLAMLGATVIMTEHTEFHSPIPVQLSKEATVRYQDASLAYVSKVHLSVKQTDHNRTVILKTHPYKSQATVKIPIIEPKKRVDRKQTTLDNWF